MKIRQTNNSNVAAGLMSPYKRITKRPVGSLISLAFGALIIAADIILSIRLMTCLTEEFMKIAILAISTVSCLRDIGAAKQSFTNGSKDIFGRLSILFACTVLSVTAAMIAVRLNENLTEYFLVALSLVRFITPRHKLHIPIIFSLALFGISYLIIFLIPDSERALKYAAEMVAKIAPMLFENLKIAFDFVKKGWLN